MAQGLAIQSIFPWMKEGKKKWTQASAHFRPVIVWNLIFLCEFREVGLWARSASKPGAFRRLGVDVEGDANSQVLWRDFHTDAQANLWEPTPGVADWELGRASQRFPGGTAGCRQVFENYSKCLELWAPCQSFDLSGSPSDLQGQPYDLCTGAPLPPYPQALLKVV